MESRKKLGLVVKGQCAVFRSLWGGDIKTIVYGGGMYTIVYGGGMETIVYARCRFPPKIIAHDN